RTGVASPAARAGRACLRSNVQSDFAPRLKAAAGNSIARVPTSFHSALPFEAQARASQINFVAGPQALAAAIAGGHLYGAAVAEDTGAEFAAVVDQAIVAGLETNVRVAA